MNKRIAIVIDNSNTIQFKTDLPTIYQGSSNSCYLDFEFASTLPTNSTVQVMFRRSDGKTTALLPTITQGDGVYTFYLNSDWYTESVGQLTFTVRVTQIVDGITNIFATSTGSLTITPSLDGLFIPSPITPSAYESINNSITEINTELDDLQDTIVNIPTQINDKFAEVNPVDRISRSSVVPTTETAHIKATYYNGTTENVEIDLPQGLATESDVDTKIEQELLDLNPVTNVTESNENMQIKVTKKDGIETNINVALPQDLVYYQALEAGSIPELEVYHSQSSDLATLAERATLADTAILANTATVANNDIGNHQLFGVDASNFSTTGYVSYANGLKIQWGKSTTTGNTAKTITLPISFTTGNAYSVILTPDTSSTVSDSVWGIRLCNPEKTNNQFSCIASYRSSGLNAYSNVDFYWIAIGY